MGFSLNMAVALGAAAVLLSLASLEMSLTGMAVHSSYKDFAQPVPSYALGSRDLSFSSAADSKTLSVSVSDYAVYRYAYASLGGGAWTPVQLSGDTLGGPWLNGSAAGQLSLTPADFSLSQPGTSAGRNFLVVYTCSRTGSAWDCHSGWQIYNFTARIAEAQSNVKIVSVSASSYQPASSYFPENTLDGDLSIESRWSAEGDGEWIQYELSEAAAVGRVGIAFYSGNRDNVFTVRTSLDGNSWATALDHVNGTLLAVQNFTFPSVAARFVRIVGHGNTGPYPGWNSYTEVRIENFGVQLSCIPESAAVTCARGCGQQTNNCGRQVSCAACPTCSDGVQNGAETGVDCGGSCAACTGPPPGFMIEPGSTVVFFGDSITNMAFQTTQYGSLNGWATTLQSEVESLCPSHDLVFINSGVGGDTTELMYERFDEDVRAYNPDYVVMMVGTNDAAIYNPNQLSNPNTWWDDWVGDYYKGMYDEMVDDIIAMGATPILMTPPISTNRIGGCSGNAACMQGVSYVLEDIAQNARDNVAQKGGILVDQRAEMASRAGGYFVDYLFSDSVHPNQAGNDMIEDILAEALGLTDGSCTASPWCGDGTCNGAETCSSCVSDCGSCPPPGNIFYVFYRQNFQHRSAGTYTQSMLQADWNYAGGYRSTQELMIEDESGNRIMKDYFDAGKFSLDQQGIDWYMDLQDQTKDELYVSYRVKFSDNMATEYSPPASGSSYPSHWLSGKAGPGFYTNMNGWRGAGYKINSTDKALFVLFMFDGGKSATHDKVQAKFYVYHIDMTCPAPDPNCWGNVYPIDYYFSPDTWHSITVRISLNTPGSSNGILEYFVNGNLINSYRVFRFRDYGDVRIMRINMANFLGGSGTVPTRDGWWAFDDIVVYNYTAGVAGVPYGTTPSPAGRTISAPSSSA